MARRTTTVTITDDNRDKGKVFVITEMPAAQAEEWFTRALMLVTRAGVDVPPNIFQHGAMGFAVMGIGAVLAGLGKAPWPDVKPLMDELFACVAIRSPNGTQTISERFLVDGQIEEFTTRFKLREEVLSMHLGFSIAARLSDYRRAATELMSRLQTTETSSTKSGSSSAPA